MLTGNVRQGALDALVQEAIAAASGVKLTAVRRAAMLAGGTVPIVVAAMTGGEDALAEVGLEVGRPVLPMLASTAPDVAAAMAKAGGAPGTPVAVDTKLDGIRIQVHRRGDEIVVATRSLDDITARLPEVVDGRRGRCPAATSCSTARRSRSDDDGRPRPFQETASRTAQSTARGVAVTPYFFDVLHVDGRDLLDAPGAERLAVLDALVPEEHRVPRLVTDDPAAAEAFAQDALARGHEGVVVKSLSIGYAAGRRGSGWVKVKPVHTLDLVVLAVEWGSGRREGWLSNIHLGARDPPATGSGFTMLGKTFKGMTDEMLAWQTERFTDLAVEPETIRDRYVVPLRPEQVVEIAFDGLQRSTRYPGGLALRFARVVRYRDDKSARRGGHHRDRARHLPPGRFADVIELTSAATRWRWRRDDGQPLGRLTMGLGWDKKPGAGLHRERTRRTSTSTRRRSSTPATSCSTWRSSTTSRPATGPSSTSATTSAAAARATTSRSPSTWPRSTHASTRCCSWSAATRATPWSGSDNAYCRLVDEQDVEIARFTLTEGVPRTGFMLAKMFRDGDALAAPGHRAGHRGHRPDRVARRPAALPLSPAAPAAMTG